MPTKLPRIALTETPELTEALALASRTWPESANSKSALVLKLVSAGVETLDHSGERRRRSRGFQVRLAAGALTGAFEERP